MNPLVAIAAGSLTLAASETPPGGAQADPPVEVGRAFAGNTISALGYHSLSRPVPGPQGGGSMERIIFHAWLAEDSTARVKLWDDREGRWLAPASARWETAGDTFCISGAALQIAADRLCFATLVWGRVFAATGLGNDIILKGDLRPGNAENF